MMTVGPPGAMCFNASRAKSRPGRGGLLEPKDLFNSGDFVQEKTMHSLMFFYHF